MMVRFSQQLDHCLAELAWSLWSELGVAGLKRSHQSISIAPEELILLTAALAKFDPRLRDEALDWCSRYHRYISTTRLRNLVKKYPFETRECVSQFNSTLNSVASTKWPLADTSKPQTVHLSGKSTLRDFASPSMLHFRLRALFGVTARADVLLFFLAHDDANFSVTDVTEIGYTKRHLSEVLQDLASAGILEMRQTGNQQRYSWKKRKQLSGILGALPLRIPPWHLIFAILLSLRDCIQRVEAQTVGSRVVEVRNLLKQLEGELSKLQLKPPPIQKNLEAYWANFTDWLLNVIKISVEK